MAIDFDGTYDLDPNMWNMFIWEANRRGHSVIIATSRSAVEGLPEIAGVLEILACGPTHKRKFCAEHKYKPDIWIDDQPETVNGPGWLWLQRLTGFFKAALRRIH